MKRFKNSLTALLILLGTSVFAQTDKATTIKIVEGQNFIFNANSAMPMANADLSRVMNRLNSPGGSGSISLTGNSYSLRVSKDSVEAYLPYYGRSFTATMNPDDSGIKFKSKDFSYKVKKNKKGTWDITIVPNDVKDRQTLNLYISQNGYATLSVNNTNRQPITFYGYLSEPKSAM